MNQLQLQRKKQRAFTLIEIMVVIVILGLLATLIVPKIVGRSDQAKVVKAQQDVMALESAMELYKLDNGFYPSTDQGLEALVVRPSTQPEPRNWKAGGYIKRLRKDPWGNDYQYLSPGNHGEIDIFSLGANGQPGGEGLDAEIGNWSQAQ